MVTTVPRSFLVGTGLIWKKKELLGRVKSIKMSYYGHFVRKHNGLEKEVIQGCT